MSSPITIYIVHHPECEQARKLATELFKWFRVEGSSAAIPVYFRRHHTQGELHPEIQYPEAKLNVVVLLIDHLLVLDEQWRHAAIALSDEIRARRKKPGSMGNAILLPIALHESFYQLSPLYEAFNPIRLLDSTDEENPSKLRRAVTEAIAREFRKSQKQQSKLVLFLSHAKKDGNEIALKLRDEVRKFSQMEAWYDANDLPYGAQWDSPMKKAAREGTAAMISIVTDVYPTRPWCRDEVTLARTPKRQSLSAPIWEVQPVVSVQNLDGNWSSGLPMLTGVARIGWNESKSAELAKQILDRLVLEVTTMSIHAEIARKLYQAEQRINPGTKSSTLYITWAPDSWTLTALCLVMNGSAKRIRRIVYPGYTLSTAEKKELTVTARIFQSRTELVSFDEAYSEIRSKQLVKASK